ncbi:MAG TPA: 2,3,4,5-tetrahydropyridine-2,6-dicarboxylate N-succinyltransferase [Chloroflexota bacterium]|jgi:2,3,4,5-tetrahydropyridine-2-carboxylate N-succinyltransferase|nr:2,3,4,5-tetrahydropyridine-2,6-dicarboxylate N-succinyltransferase [Chloroflexota bacterium]
MAETWNDARHTIETAYAGTLSLDEPRVRETVEATIAALDRGELRAAERRGPGEWTANAWVKQAILLYIRLRQMEKMEVGPFEFYDKIPLKRNLESLGVRVVPPGTIRYGAYVERGVIVMPGYVNIGAWVGSGTMVDTWATVGSCAQVGRNVHLAGGVGIGGVLEPPQAQPVIVEDNAFIGSRCIVVEGAVVEEEAILAAGVTITATSHIVDVRDGQDGKIYRGRVPARAVVIPGTRRRTFPGGEAYIACAYIIGTRNEANDKKVSLESALREYEIVA